MPLKKKVRGERSAKTKPNTTTTTTAPTSGPDKAFKRNTGQPVTAQTSANKKKKRVAAAVVDEDQTPAMATATAVATATNVAAAPIVESAAVKTKNQSKQSKSKHKAIIDYSKQNNHTNTFGKVQKWLLESPNVATETPSTSAAGTTMELATEGTDQSVNPNNKVRNHLMSKSQSTPERLAGARSPTGKKVPSTGNLNDKVKLQVVYKPPFKFSLKLSKNSAVKTKVIGSGSGGNARAKQQQKLQQQQQQQLQNRSKPGRSSGGDADGAAVSSRRTAMLVRSVSVEDNDKDDIDLIGAVSEPAYETLKPKRGAADSTPVYENVHLKPTTPNSTTAAKDPPFSSATFRISKSGSSSSLTRKPQTKVLTKHRGSSSNLHQINGSRSSQNDLQQTGTSDTPFGSSQNLIRSSTTNLTKHHRSSFGQGQGRDLSRSSTTNLNKQRRSPHGGSQSNLHQHRPSHGSNSNLFFDDFSPTSRSRRNSLAKQTSPDSTASKSSVSRTSSNSNLKIPSTTRRGSISNNNIPRANLKSGSFNQHNVRHNGPSTSPPNGHQYVKRPSDRPHTADCTDGPSPMEFEWPRPVLGKDDPLPSDLEVMVSDVENLVTDT